MKYYHYDITVTEIVKRRATVKVLVPHDVSAINLRKIAAMRASDTNAWEDMEVEYLAPNIKRGEAVEIEQPDPSGSSSAG